MKMMVASTTFRLGVVLTVFLLHFAMLASCTGENDDVGFETHHRSLAGAAIITTTACNVIRSQTDYQARLDLFYFYLVECNAGTIPDLEGIERAIATSIASKLNDCNEENGPLYAVQVTGTGHSLSTGGDCDASQAGHQCYVIRGQTSIFLDKDPSDVEAAAYEEIESTLNNHDLLNQFTNSSLVSAELIRRIGENLVILDEQSPSVKGAANDTSASAGGESLGRVTTKIAVAAACIAFTLTTLFIYGVLRHQVAAVQAGNPTTKMRLAHLQAKRRKFWNNLEEGNESPRYMVTDHPLPSITWSVSDLTSDSASIRSALRMDRIEEEDSREGAASLATDEEVDSTASAEKTRPPIAPPEKKKLSPSMPNPDILVNYIPAHWKDKTETDCSEVGSNIKSSIKLGSVWDLAGMPESYFGDSDPEAETPVRSSSVNDFDVTTGSYGACPFMEDYSLDDESADVLLLFDLDNHNITDPTEDSENLHKNVIAVTKDDVQDGDEIRHSSALTLTDEEEQDDVGTISPSSTSEGTNSGEEALLSWSVSEEEDESSSSSSFKDAKQTLTDSTDTSTQPHEVAVVNLVPQLSPDVSWPRAHAKGEWTQIEDSTTVKVAHAHAKGEWAQTKGSSAIKVEYLQFFTPELGKATNELKKVIKSAPFAPSKPLDFLSLQPTKAASMSRLAAPSIPSLDESVTDESKCDEARNNTSIASSNNLEFFSPQPAKATSKPRVNAPRMLADDDSATDETKVVKEEPRSTPISKALDFLVPPLSVAASSVTFENVSPLPTIDDENVTGASNVVKVAPPRSIPVASSMALDFPSPQPFKAATSSGSLEKVSPKPTQDENAENENNVVKERLSRSSSNVSLSSKVRHILISPQKTSKKTTPISSFEVMFQTPLQDDKQQDKSVLKSWAQTVMNKLMTDKNQKLLSM